MPLSLFTSCAHWKTMRPERELYRKTNALATTLKESLMSICAQNTSQLRSHHGSLFCTNCMWKEDEPKGGTLHLRESGRRPRSQR